MIVGEGKARPVGYTGVYVCVLSQVPKFPIRCDPSYGVG